jgi:hypothetical protein
VQLEHGILSRCNRPLQSLLRLLITYVALRSTGSGSLVRSAPWTTSESDSLRPRRAGHHERGCPKLRLARRYRRWHRCAAGAATHVASDTGSGLITSRDSGSKPVLVPVFTGAAISSWHDDIIKARRHQGTGTTTSRHDDIKARRHQGTTTSTRGDDTARRHHPSRTMTSKHDTAAWRHGTIVTRHCTMTRHDGTARWHTAQSTQRITHQQSCQCCVSQPQLSLAALGLGGSV